MVRKLSLPNPIAVKFTELDAKSPFFSTRGSDTQLKILLVAQFSFYAVELEGKGSMPGSDSR